MLSITICPGVRHSDPWGICNAVNWVKFVKGKVVIKDECINFREDD